MGQKATAVIVLLIISAGASADCLHPLKEPISRDGKQTTVNSVPNATTFCVSRPTQFCTECEPGFMHECRDGRWYANKEMACGETDSPAASNQEAAGNTTVVHQNSDASDAAIALHGATIACGGGAPLSAVQRSLENRKDPLWEGPPPTTTADIIKLTQAHHEKDQEFLRDCQSKAAEDCSRFEERLVRSDCLVREIKKFE
jgi:hypothetical protein